MTERIELTIPERAALAALGWRDAYVGARDKMAAARATLTFLNQLAEIYGPTGQDDQPQWIKRTMADVRPGDSIRPPGDLITPSIVTARCWPPTDDTRGRGSWHVIEGADGHWSDHVIQPGECCVHLDGAGHRLFRPTFPVEILLTASEVAAIELLGGWANRERMITD